MTNETVELRHVTYMANGNLKDARTVKGTDVSTVTPFGVVIFQPFDNNKVIKKILIPWQWIIEFGWWRNDPIGHSIVGGISSNA